MSDTCLLSLIVPVYNVEGTVEACLESALAELPDDCEIVCVDDGSTDHSIPRVRQMLERYPVGRSRVRIIAQANQGLSGARNAGIEAARGDYIGLLDSDDLLCAGYFNAIRRVIERCPDVSIICFNAERFERQVSGETRRYFLPVHAGAMDIDATRTDWIDRLADNFGRGRWFAWARVYDKRIFEIGRFADHFRYQDMLLLPDLYRRARRIVNIDDVLVSYRTHAASVTASPNVDTFACLDAIIERYGRPARDLPATLDDLRHLVVLSALESVFHAARRRDGSLAARRELRVRQRCLGRRYVFGVLARFRERLAVRSLLLHASPLAFVGMGYSKRQLSRRRMSGYSE